MSYIFWWDESNIEHIADHGVEPYEAEEVIDDDPLQRRNDTSAGENKMQKLPEFESDEELAAWIDQHDTAPYMDDMEEVGEKFEVIRTLFATKPVDVRLRQEATLVSAARRRR